MLALLSYPIETILAEKIETILSRGIASTRPRDIYDVYMLSKLRRKDIDVKVFADALHNTMMKRKSNFKIIDYPVLLERIKCSEVQQQLWRKYQIEYKYAKEVSFENALHSIELIMNELNK